ncbi:hypothetical protein ARMSODRAFT_529022 [Armillaria solidipes]|uniref:Uncharacterized protein n=1 Tax=Armillaria solidipes TaxID=1076256 RepID=A0A2H3B3W5_9AGAR|nr:hypothetical protein ARMSODRAFT_529022 [Armillaria solidipes]
MALRHHQTYQRMPQYPSSGPHQFRKANRRYLSRLSRGVPTRHLHQSIITFLLTILPIRLGTCIQVLRTGTIPLNMAFSSAVKADLPFLFP